MSDAQAVARALAHDLAYYAPLCLSILAKDGALTPLSLNPAQRTLHARLNAQQAKTGRVRAVVLKGRQMGISTYVQARFFQQTSLHRGRNAFILTHRDDATRNIYRMVRRFHAHCPDPIKPRTQEDSSTGLVFADLDSAYRVGTAGAREVGRSATIQLFHGSEVAAWPNADSHAAGILQAIPSLPGTEIILESTALGAGNFFHRMWRLGLDPTSGWQSHFIPWFWEPGYAAPVPEDFALTEEETELMRLYALTPGQLCFRRVKVAEFAAAGREGAAVFRQEYPSNADEAFLAGITRALIPVGAVIEARRAAVEAIGPVVVGVDPARGGANKTAIIRRQGRLAWGLERLNLDDTMQVAGRVHQIITQDKPARVFVDVIGVGAGVVDRLREMGHHTVVMPVNAAGSPLDRARYVNKRAEMWDGLREWLEDAPVQVPDEDLLQAELTALEGLWDSSGRLMLESKADLRRRLNGEIDSPDGADALALTHAFPVLSQDAWGELHYARMGIR